MVTLKDRPQIQLRENWLELLAHELGEGRKIKCIRSHRRSHFNRTIIVVFASGKSRFVKAGLVVDVATLPPYEVVQLGETLASLAQNQINQVQTLMKLGRSEANAFAQVVGFQWDTVVDDGFISADPDGTAPWPSAEEWEKRGCPPLPLWAWKGAIVSLRSFDGGKKLPRRLAWDEIPTAFNSVINERALAIYAYYRSDDFWFEYDDPIYWAEQRFNHRGLDFHDDVMREGGYDDVIDYDDAIPDFDDGFKDDAGLCPEFIDRRDKANFALYALYIDRLGAVEGNQEFFTNFLTLMGERELETLLASKSALSKINRAMFDRVLDHCKALDKAGEVFTHDQIQSTYGAVTAKHLQIEMETAKRQSETTSKSKGFGNKR